MKKLDDTERSLRDKTTGNVIKEIGKFREIYSMNLMFAIALS